MVPKTVLIVMALVAIMLASNAGSGAGLLVRSVHAADSYDWTKPRGSIYSRRRGPNLWSGSQPYRSPLYQRPSRRYGIPNFRQPRGINPYQRPRRNYGGWGQR